MTGECHCGLLEPFRLLVLARVVSVPDMVEQNPLPNSPPHGRSNRQSGLFFCHLIRYHNLYLTFGKSLHQFRTSFINDRTGSCCGCSAYANQLRCLFKGCFDGLISRSLRRYFYISPEPITPKLQIRCLSRADGLLLVGVMARTPTKCFKMKHTLDML